MRSEEQQKDFDKRAETIINNLKGITRSEIKKPLIRVDYFLEEQAIIK